MKIDLHVHTDASDGKESISHVMQRAHQLGIDVMGLTDHDTTQGWQEATELAFELGMGLVPGMELTTRAHVPRADGSILKFGVHLLNYLSSPDDANLQRVLNGIHEGRSERLMEMSELISKRWAHTWDDVIAEVQPGPTLGRTAIADALVSRGHFEIRDQVFETVWGKSAGFYVPNRKVPDTIDAIALVREAGGVPVIAHPLSRSKHRNPGDPFPIENFNRMIEAGLAGIEVYHRENSDEDRAWLLEVATENNLIVTGSSDYHGVAGKDNELAENTTTPEMLARLIAQSSGTRAINIPALG
jgi:predicted metal-dependent phosphoesterase TrpH